VENKKRIEGYLSKDEERNQVKIYLNQQENTDYICTEYEPVLYSRNALKERNSDHEAVQKNISRKDDRLDEASSKSETKNEMDEVLGNFTLLQVMLITGKSHQIRAHLASIGHPLIGDYKYGDQKTNHYFKRKYDLTHQLLHSNRIIFPEIEGELSYLSNKEFVAETPELFQKIQKDLFF
jgi:23S rRNA pseudouridine955/2504/2580 synthase